LSIYFRAYQKFIIAFVLMSAVLHTINMFDINSCNSFCNQARVLNGMEGTVDKDFIRRTLFVNISQGHSEEAFVNLDGLCSFEDQTFRASTGGLMLNGDGFLEEWRYTSI